MDIIKENLNGLKKCLSGLEYLRVMGLVYVICIFIVIRIFYEINGLVSDLIFNFKYSYYVWLVGLIAVLLFNFLFNLKGRLVGYFIIEIW